MWDAVIEALGFGVRATFWIFKSIFVGYAQAFRWFQSRGQGQSYAFPAGRFLLSVMLTLFLAWFASLTNSGNTYRSTDNQSRVGQQYSTPYPSRRDTATASAVQQNLTPQVTRYSPTPTPSPTSTRGPTPTQARPTATTSEPVASQSSQPDSNTIPGAAPPPKTLSSASSDTLASATPTVASQQEEASATIADTVPPAAPVSKPILEWIRIPGGNFVMGSSDKDLEATLVECNETEGKATGRPCQIGWFKEPRRTVFVDAFEIAKNETTNAQYEACVATGVCNKANTKVDNSVPAYDEGYFSNDYPVVRVSWNDANTFCQWINGRLPTEEEWEKAARGTDGRRYPWGNTFTPSRANLGSTYPAPVGSFPEGASPYGVMDMAGNVFEWTATRGERGYVLRGGSWNNYYFRGRVTDRGTQQLEPGFANYDIGFRCARGG